MTTIFGFKNNARRLSVILVPIIITQITMFSMSFIDTVMSGRAGAIDLAGVAVGSSLWIPALTGLTGILGALTPIVAQMVGAKSHDEIPKAVFQGVYLATALTAVITAAGALLVTPILNTMDLESGVRFVARGYLVGLCIGILPVFIATVLRSFIDALGHTRVTMAIMIVSLPINVVLNYVLIFGKGGFPRLGGVGAGYATAVTYWIVAFISAAVVLRMRPFSQYKLIRQPKRISWPLWQEQLRVGLPIGLSIFLEVGVFSAVALLMSRFGTAAIAAHQAAINVTSLMYMLPLSVSMALTIAVGHAVGARRIDQAISVSYLGVGASLTSGLFTVTTLLLFSNSLAALYTSDPAVLELTRSFLFYAAFIQIADVIGAPMQGILRGYKDVRVTLFLSFVSYWLIGLPFGYYLSVQTSLGPFGYWIGLIAGLVVGAVGLLWRLNWIQRRYRRLQDPDATVKPAGRIYET